MLNKQHTKYKIYLLISYGNVVHEHTTNAVTALYKMIESRVVIFIILSDNAISYMTKHIAHNKGIIIALIREDSLIWILK